MFRQFRKIEPGEYIVVGVDSAAGGGDYVAAQFISKTNIDVPLIYQSKQTMTEFTNKLAEVLEKIHDVTQLRPTVAIERANGGSFEMDRLASMNRSGKFELFKMPNYGRVDAPEAVKYGWDTNTATRPKMLADLKDAVDHQVLGIYDKDTVNELFSFVVVQTSSSWKAQAESGAHDDCFVAGTLILTDKGQVPIENIKVGGMVMTRMGLRRVEMTRSKPKPVMDNIGLRGTKDHPIILANGQEKPLSKVSEYDTLHVWNEQLQKIEKLSYIEAKSIIVTQTPKDDNSGFITGDTISGKAHPSHYIDSYGLITLEKSLKDIISTTKTTMHSIMRYLTYNLFLRKNIVSIILGKEDIRRLAYASTNIVVKPLSTPIQSENRDSVTHSAGVETEMVYNLQISGQPEYFANNILVHNCVMSLAIAWQLYQIQPQRKLDRPFEQPVFKPSDDVIGI